MYKNNGFGFVFALVGIIMLLFGVVTDAGPNAYTEYNKTKKGIPPRVQKIRLLVGGSLLIVVGILIYLDVL